MKSTQGLSDQERNPVCAATDQEIQPGEFFVAFMFGQMKPLGDSPDAVGYFFRHPHGTLHLDELVPQTIAELLEWLEQVFVAKDSLDPQKVEELRAIRDILAKAREAKNQVGELLDEETAGDGDHSDAAPAEGGAG
jgi:hypothetical protein